MRKKINVFMMFVISVCFLSCEDELQKEIQSGSNYTALIINQGNFNESNGSLSLWVDNRVLNRVYEDANEGEKLASVIESAVDCGSSWALLCNSEDKIVWVDKMNFKELAVLKSVPAPRYGVYKDGYLYVTSVTDWSGADGSVFKIDLSSKSVDSKIIVKGTPEGLLWHDEELWVATSYFYNPTTWMMDSAAVACVKSWGDAPIYYTSDKGGVSAKHLMANDEGRLFVSLSGYGLAEVDEEEGKLVDFVQLKEFFYSGHLYQYDGEIYYLTSDGGSAGYSNGGADEKTTVSKVDLFTRSSSKVAEGNGFYGFGVNPSDGRIYTANCNGFFTNSICHIYENNGSKVECGDPLAGVGTCRFYFPKW
jgi:hypothetical protein